jgi:hypothetical protein
MVIINVASLYEKVGCRSVENFLRLSIINYDQFLEKRAQGITVQSVGKDGYSFAITHTLIENLILTNACNNDSDSFNKLDLAPLARTLLEPVPDSGNGVVESESVSIRRLEEPVKRIMRSIGTGDSSKAVVHALTFQSLIAIGELGERILEERLPTGDVYPLMMKNFRLSNARFPGATPQ